MNVIGYVRVSTDEQAESGHGLAAQEQRIQEAVVARGWTLVDVCRDEGATAKHLDRPALTSALERIAAGEADGLAVAKLDRLTRSVIDFATLLQWFQDADAALVALDFDLDTSTPGGRLVAHIFAAVAEWERDMIAQRTREGLRAARSAGRVLGHPAVSDRPEVAERVRELRSDGLTLDDICRMLELEGIPTSRGAERWRPSALQTILGRPRRSSRRAVSLPPVRSAR